MSTRVLTSEESEVLERIQALNAASRRRVLAAAKASLATKPPADEQEFEQLFQSVFGGWNMSDAEAQALWEELRALRRRSLQMTTGGAESAERAERLRHLRRAVELWPRSDEETRQLMDEIEAAREIEE